MHIKKNCERIVKYILGLLKNNDGYVNAEDDIKYLMKKVGVVSKIFLPRAHKEEGYYIMSKVEKGGFVWILYEVKVLDGYTENISRYFKDWKFQNLKSHAYHILTHQQY